MEILDIDVGFSTPGGQEMNDEVVNYIMNAIREDSNSMIDALSTTIWDINLEDSTSRMTFDSSLNVILASIAPYDEEIKMYLCREIQSCTQFIVEESVVEAILQNTLYSGRKIDKHTRVSNIPMNDLSRLVANVMTACNLNNPWYKMWHFSRDVTRAYRPFNPTSYPGYFQAKDMKDMIVVALNICNMQPSAASICVLDDTTKRYEIDFVSLSDLVEHKFNIKPSNRNDKFITYDGITIKLRTLTLYDIQILKYLIKYFDCDASRSIYQLLSSMMRSEKDIKLAHDIGWFSGISLDAFADSRQEMYLLADTTCEKDTYFAIKRISKDCENLMKGFVRDFKYQSSTAPAAIWIALASLIFALVSVLDFLMGL